MNYRGKTSASECRGELYPNNMNAAGVPLIGQTGVQAIKNFDQIIQQLSIEQRQVFEQARRQACEEIELERCVEGGDRIVVQRDQ